MIAPVKIDRARLKECLLMLRDKKCLVIVCDQMLMLKDECVCLSVSMPVRWREREEERERGETT